MTLKKVLLSITQYMGTYNAYCFSFNTLLMGDMNSRLLNVCYSAHGRYFNISCVALCL